jgi:hypothetical protein
MHKSIAERLVKAHEALQDATKEFVEAEKVFKAQDGYTKSWQKPYPRHYVSGTWMIQVEGADQLDMCRTISFSPVEVL